jgi:hypothetical protein
MASIYHKQARGAEWHPYADGRGLGRALRITPEHGNGRCDDLNLADRRNVFWPYTVRFITSFVWTDIYLELPIIGY